MSKKPFSRIPDHDTLGRNALPLVDRDYPHFNKKKVVVWVVVALLVLLLVLAAVLWPA